MPKTEKEICVKTKKSFLTKLNEVKKELYGADNFHPFTLRQLNYYAYSKFEHKKYISFQIPKKKVGEFRTITAPNKSLKCLQRCINALLLSSFKAHPAATGFVPGKSILDNAKMHLGQNYVYNIDLKDFFPSVTAGRVFACLQLAPLSFDKDIASLITDLCCYEDMLPQGAPTSPTLTNIVCYRLDWRLAKLAQRYKLQYSRYADDITFSGPENLFHEDGDFVKELHHFVEKEGFMLNKDKTRLNNKYQRQEVTGLTINEKPNVTQQYVKQIRTMLKNWEKSGYDYAQSKFIECYQPTNNTESVHRIELVINGKLNYMKMVKGKDDSTYQRLRKRFEVLFLGAPSQSLDVTLQRLCESQFDLSVL